MLHVAEEDLKPRYKPLKGHERERRIMGFLKSIKVTFNLFVKYEVKEHNTAAFTIMDQEGQSVSKETKRTVSEFLLGELCDVSGYSIWANI